MSDFKLNDNQRRLAEENESMIWKMLKTYNLDDEWYGLLANAFCKAAYMYDPNQNTKFQTVAIKYMKTAIQNEFRNRKLDKYKLCDSSEEIISLDMDATEEGKTLNDIIPDENCDFDEMIHGKVDAIQVLADCWNGFTDIQKQYVVALYELLISNGSVTQREIGEKIGVSQQRSNELKNQIKTKLVERW